MDSVAGHLATVLIACTIFLAIVVWLNSRRPLRLPPGPRGLPFIGNTLDMPSSYPWETFGEWGKKWGAMTYITLFGQHYLVVNSLSTAIGMLEAKSTIYSDRPSFPMLGEIMGWKDGVAVGHYGERVRALRRLLHQAMGTPVSIAKRIPVIEMEVHRFLQRLLDAQSDQFIMNIRSAVNAATLRLAYGCEAHDLDDPLVNLTELVTEQFACASIPGTFLVDTLPFLRHIPEWFPGTGWKQLGREWGANARALVNMPFELVRSRRAAGVSVSSFTDDSITEGMTEQEQDLVKWAANAMVLGGTDTVMSTITTFFLAMARYPEVQRKAQEEIDAVVGTQRLPNIDDVSSLPYINSLLKEVLRWGPATPLAGPHRLTRDDEQDGYFIPEGTTVIINVWGLLRDESIYSGPLTFNPDRFMASEVKPAEIDPRICFGLGRRICPGVRIAEATLFLFFATTLATYQISKTVDKSGTVLEPTVRYTSRLICHPIPFPCTIKPRSEQAVALIRSLHLTDSD